jgi:spermidine/putrescine transport system substrate-binding protein
MSLDYRTGLSLRARRHFLKHALGTVAGLTAARGLDPLGMAKAFADTLTGPLVMSSWPYYMDKVTIPDFEKKFGIDVKYIEDINDNDGLFGKIAGPLQAGRNPSRDIIVPTDFMAGRLIKLGWVEKFTPTDIPNIKNLDPTFAHPTWDTNREYSLPWVSFLTGVAYNIEKTGRELTSINDIFDPAFKGHVSMLSEMRDTMALMFLAMGIDPSKATYKDAEAAVQKVKDNVASGQIRQFFGNDYGAALSRGDIWVAFAWSGDVIQLQKDNPNIRFMNAKEGYLRAEDDMVIPLKAEHRDAALAFMNYVYDPEVFAHIIATIQYIPPVAGTRELVRKIDPALADNPLIYPSPELLAKSYSFAPLTAAEEHKWNVLFQGAIGH